MLHRVEVTGVAGAAPPSWAASTPRDAAGQHLDAPAAVRAGSGDTGGARSSGTSTSGPATVVASPRLRRPDRRASSGSGPGVSLVEQLGDDHGIRVGEHHLDGRQRLAPPALAAPGPLARPPRGSTPARASPAGCSSVGRVAKIRPARPGAEDGNPWWSRSTTSRQVEREAAHGIRRHEPRHECGVVALAPRSALTAERGHGRRHERSTVTGTPLSTALPDRPSTTEGSVRSLIDDPGQLCGVRAAGRPRAGGRSRAAGDTTPGITSSVACHLDLDLAHRRRARRPCRRRGCRARRGRRGARAGACRGRPRVSRARVVQPGVVVALVPPADQQQLAVAEPGPPTARRAARASVVEHQRRSRGRCAGRRSPAARAGAGSSGPRSTPAGMRSSSAHRQPRAGRAQQRVELPARAEPQPRLGLQRGPRPPVAQPVDRSRSRAQRRGRGRSPSRAARPLRLVEQRRGDHRAVLRTASAWKTRS